MARVVVAKAVAAPGLVQVGTAVEMVAVERVVVLAAAMVVVVAVLIQVGMVVRRAEGGRWAAASVEEI